MATIDADTHVIETDQTRDYMTGEDAQFRPVLVTPESGSRQYWLIDGRIFSRGSNVNKNIPAESREMRDIETRLRHMDDLEIDVQVLYPSLFLRPLTARSEVERALCKSYNHWLADLWRKGVNRLRWAAVLP